MSILSAIQSKKILSKISSICLTDAIFDEKIFDEIDHYIPTKNWIRSKHLLDKNLTKDQSYPDFYVSAGTMEHERTSYSAINSVFEFIFKHF